MYLLLFERRDNLVVELLRHREVDLEGRPITLVAPLLILAAVLDTVILYRHTPSRQHLDGAAFHKLHFRLNRLLLSRRRAPSNFSCPLPFVSSPVRNLCYFRSFFTRGNVAEMRYVHSLLAHLSLLRLSSPSDFFG